MRRVFLSLCLVVASLLGWQANADHCAVQDMSALTEVKDMPCHEMKGHDVSPTELPPQLDHELCCCAAAIVTITPELFVFVERQAWSPVWRRPANDAVQLSALSAEPPPPRS